MEEGYKILGKKGPSIPIYKCILVSLCRVGKVSVIIIIHLKYLSYYILVSESVTQTE